MELTVNELYSFHALNGGKERIMGTNPEFLKDASGESLQKTIAMGYEEMQARGWVGDQELAEEAVELGYMIQTYCSASRYLVINDGITCAVDVDQSKLYTIFLEEIDSEHYRVEKIPKLLLMAMMVKEIPFLRKLEQRIEETTDWDVMSTMLFQVIYKDKDFFTMRYYENGKSTYESVILDTGQGIVEFDVKKERMRVIAGRLLQKQITKLLKVRLS